LAGDIAELTRDDIRLVDRFHETDQIGQGRVQSHLPRPEGAVPTLGVSKDGRWHNLPVAILRDAHRNRLLLISTPLKCRSRAGPASVHAPPDEVD
jgi:hypothetical protein